MIKFITYIVCRHKVFFQLMHSNYFLFISNVMKNIHFGTRVYHVINKDDRVNDFTGKYGIKIKQKHYLLNLVFPGTRQQCF